ncbi:hypothetical protein F4802DRAFT_551689 [Xylaria palmicola]|nr:hypothetical protein F4802DRAFT_551689 [Xylaria palmicola]
MEHVSSLFEAALPHTCVALWFVLVAVLGGGSRRSSPSCVAGRWMGGVSRPSRVLLLDTDTETVKSWAPRDV